MSIHQLSIMGALRPDASGRAFFEPYDVKATNDLFKHFVGVLNDPAAAQAHGFYGRFLVPQNYVGSAVIKPVWGSAATSGNVKLDFDYRAVGGDSAESMDQATFQESVTVTDACPAFSNYRATPSLTLTSSNLAAGDTVEFYFTREDGSGTDTMAAAALLHDLIFEYADV